MKSIKLPSQAKLKALFDYNPETGVLTWKNPNSNRVKTGDVAGSKNNKGYLIVGIHGIAYYNHRIIWIMCNSEILNGYQIDHINGIKNDNRLSNLRLASSSQNKMNTSAYKNNQTGVKGLSEWVNSCGTIYWKCQIWLRVNGKRDLKHKSFHFTESTKESQKEVAIAWLERTRAELHGEFTNHGTI